MHDYITARTSTAFVSLVEISDLVQDFGNTGILQYIYIRERINIEINLISIGWLTANCGSFRG